MNQYEWIINLIFLIVGFIFGNISPKIKREVDETDEKVIKLPTLNPMQIYKDKKSKQEQELREQEIKTMLENIDNYDGTSNHQKDI